MTSTAPSLASQLAAAVSALGAVSTVVADFQAVDDAALVSLSRLAAREKQLADAHLALVAGEIAARSSRELGHAGLAQRSGFRSAEELLKTTTGASGREAVTAVRVGRLVREAAVAAASADGTGAPDPTTGVAFVAAQPWLAPVAAAVAAGTLSVGAADAIRAGLGTPTETVPAEALAGAAAALCTEAAPSAEGAGLDVDRLARRARELRDELDEAGIADRERERFEKRSLRHFRLPDGMGRLVWDLDPESYAVVSEICDRATSPKRGVRFVAGPQREIADRILADPRSIDQLASDTLLTLLQAGADADTTRLLGKGTAVVRVLVTAATRTAGTGHGRIEGTPDPVSLATVERLACDGATTRINIDAFGNPLDVGDEQRLFTPKQRIALAIRDGGCLFGDCDRPPSMTEAHHIIPWSEGGKTDIDNGVLLCKFHHLLLHNNGWRIQRIDGHLVLIPPKSIDPSQAPRPMPSKCATLQELLAETEAQQQMWQPAAESA